jgi:galactokinase
VESKDQINESGVRMTTMKQALQSHRQRFGEEGRAFAAPARVNLIGEHTDYTGGFVMPMAIGFQTIAVISPRVDNRAVFYSTNYEEEVTREISTLGREPHGHWSDYPVGVLWSLQREGILAGGFSMSLVGDVPLGAGLSSSASVEVAAALALLSRAKVSLSMEKIAILCRRAENEFVGAKSGIMDQFIVAGGVAHRAMMIDCRSLGFELLPLPEEVRVVICNSMVKHAVATGEYGHRRDEVEAGQEVLRQADQGIELLRDATIEDLEACRSKMSIASFLRCRHIITENGRVIDAKRALVEGNVRWFGELMVDAHASMRDDFAASCKEVDALVEIAMEQQGCLGARITGGGFGGCTVNVVLADQADRFVESVRHVYEQQTEIAAQCFICEASDGAVEVARKGGPQ